MPGSLKLSLSIISALALPTFCSPFADEIKITGPRPLAGLVFALVDRYDYFVTFEDAPADSSREIRMEKRLDGVEIRHLVWIPMVFHVDASPDPETSTDVSERTRLGTQASGEPVAATRRPTRGAMQALLTEYHASGNPGKFTVIYDKEYAHIVPAGRSVDGRLQEFQPILSTTVPVSQQSGLCMNVLKGLLGEIGQIRGTTIAWAAVPLNPLLQRQCMIRGHDLPAREVLIQILDQLGSDLRTGLPEDHFAWVLLHDPTSNSYFLSTRLILPHGPASQATQGRLGH